MVNEIHCPEGFDISVICINAGDGSGADIIFEFNTRNICVSILAGADGPALSRGETAIEDHLINLLGQAAEASDDEYERTTDKVLDAILDAGRHIFVKAVAIAPQCCTTAPTSLLVMDLHSYLYPETLYFRLQTIADRLTVREIRPGEANTLPDTDLDPEFVSDYSQIYDQLPRHSSRELIISEFLFKGSAVVGRVCIEGREMLCKAHRSGLQDASLKQELTNLDRIRRVTGPGEAGEDVGKELTTTNGIRVPMLHGYITHAGIQLQR
ncbi:hypothetical protein DV737_g5627, partial [Chaetothyriales sp. CBS 132003]